MSESLIIRRGGEGTTVFPTGIVITTAPTKISYKAGETINISGMVVTATFSDGSTQVVTSECTCSPSVGATVYEDTNKIVVNWTYNDLGVPISYSVNQTIVVTRVLSSITITTKPTTTYYIGDSFSTNGMVITATFTSGNTSVVTGWSTSPSNGTTITSSTSTTLTVTYTENGVTKTASTTLTIKYKTYTIKIDQSNSNPLSCCTYADNAVGMTKGSDAWDDIFGHRPCILDGGTVVGYLNPDDYSKYVSGSSAPITTLGKDVMVEFPVRGIKISTTNNVISVSLTENPNDSSFTYYAHQRGTTKKNNFYLGAYDANLSSSKLYSQSGVTPVVNITLTNSITYATNRGSGYDIMGYYQVVYLQCLYLLKYGNLNSQTAVGMGLVSASGKINNGTMNSKGMDWGETAGTSGMKIFGVENFWGNIYQWVGGIYGYSNTIRTTTQNFANFTSSPTSSTYTQFTTSCTTGNGGWVNKVSGTSTGGFLSTAWSGSSTTYYCDCGSVGSGCFARFGGYWSNGASAGAFLLNVNWSASNSSSDLGARLMYL